MRVLVQHGGCLRSGGLWDVSPVNQAPQLAYEPWLQTGQARLGALDLHCRDLACQPHAPVGRADWGRENIVIRGTDVAPHADRR